ncbi:hypothetical protein OXX80_009211 [Metschnikowia pulcherrima]
MADTAENSEPHTHESDSDDSVTSREDAAHEIDAETTLNPEYGTYFNEHVTSFFNLQYLDRYAREHGPTSVLFPSKNTLNGAYYFPRPRITSNQQHDSVVEDSFCQKRYAHDPDQTELDPEVQAQIAEIHSLPGTVWSVAEKEKFFECLARYSIHRLDAFEPYFPHKSRAELEAYYHLLKESLRRETRYKTCNTFLMTEGRHRHNTTYTMRVFERGTPYWRIPAALEMDDSWVEFEEQQSHLYAVRESQQANGQMQRQAPELDAYLSGGADAGANLIDADVANEIARVYRGNNITPVTRAKRSGRLSLSALVFLDELVKARVRDVFMELVMQKGTNSVDSEPDMEVFGTKGEDPDINVTPMDVWRATESLRLYETPKGGFKSRYRDGKTPFLHTYWENIISSLKIKVHERRKRVPMVVKKYFKHMSKYEDTDFFFREVSSYNDAIEIPEGLAELTAEGVIQDEEHKVNRTETGSTSDHQDEDESASGDQSETGTSSDSSVDGDSLSWDLPAPWDMPDSELGQESEETNPLGENGHNEHVPNPKGSVNSQQNIREHGAVPSGPFASISSGSDVDASTKKNDSGARPQEIGCTANIPEIPRLFHFSDLEQSESFSRKRVLEDVLIEDYLDDDVMEHAESQDRKLALKKLKMARKQMGLEHDESSVKPEKRKNYMSQSAIHMLFDKTYASYD